MKKLNLDLDQLSVESFDTSAVARPQGTVRGFDITDTTCYELECGCISGGTCRTDCGQNTCGDTCGGNTCGDSCINICPTGNMHTCIQPNCFHTYECVSGANYTDCCLG